MENYEDMQKIVLKAFNNAESNKDICQLLLNDPAKYFEKQGFLIESKERFNLSFNELGGTAVIKGFFVRDSTEVDSLKLSFPGQCTICKVTMLSVAAVILNPILLSGAFLSASVMILISSLTPIPLKIIQDEAQAIIACAKEGTTSLAKKLCILINQC